MTTYPYDIVCPSCGYADNAAAFDNKLVGRGAGACPKCREFVSYRRCSAVSSGGKRCVNKASEFIKDSIVCGIHAEPHLKVTFYDPQAH